MSFWSLIALTISFAFSEEMPCWIFAPWRTVALAAGSIFRKSSDLDGDAAFDETGLEDVDDGLELVLVVRRERQEQFLLVPLDLRLRAPEIEAGGDLLGGLLDGVRDLLEVHLADDVEGEFLRHCGEISISGAGMRDRGLARLRATVRSVLTSSSLSVPGPGSRPPAAPSRVFQPSKRNSVTLPEVSWYDRVSTVPESAIFSFSQARSDWAARGVSSRPARTGPSRSRTVSRELVGLVQEHDGQPHALVGRQLVDGELPVLGRVEAAFPGVVREDLVVRRRVVEPQALGRLDPDRSRLSPRGREPRRSVDLGESGGVAPPRTGRRQPLSRAAPWPRGRRSSARRLPRRERARGGRPIGST